jgi:TatD DNase family protein
VGRHPNYAHAYERSELADYRELLSHPKAVALGEIGLDFHWDFATRNQQERALFDQLDLADELGKPVVFHCREAYPELLTILESRRAMRYLFHCFAGDADDAQRAVRLDCHFGVDGPITYKKADALREVIAGLPRNRVVLETDSPYMSPAPYRGKPNRPSYLPFIAQGLASVWDVSADFVAQETTTTARAYFGLPSSNNPPTSFV